MTCDVSQAPMKRSVAPFHLDWKSYILHSMLCLRGRVLNGANVFRRSESGVHSIPFKSRMRQPAFCGHPHPKGCAHPALKRKESNSTESQKAHIRGKLYSELEQTGENHAFRRIKAPQIHIWFLSHRLASRG